MAGPATACAHDHDRFRLPSASPPQKSEAGKKESTDRRLSQAYQRCVTPSSNSSLDCRRNVARTAEGGFATHSGVSKSAKVVLIALQHPNCLRRLDDVSTAQLREVLSRLIKLRPKYLVITDDLLLKLGGLL